MNELLNMALTRQELTVVFAGVLLAAFLVGWVCHWIWSRAASAASPREDRANELVAELLIVEEARDRAQAEKRELEAALRGNFDLIVLDVMLPGLNGFEVCEAIRERDREIAIIMLTARAADEDIVNGLRLGADDYVAKPFGIQELVLRAEAVLRRTRGVEDEQRHLVIDDGATLDCASLNLLLGDSSVRLTRRETEMLRYLHAHADRAVSREELLGKVWGYGQPEGLETRTVDIHIAKLRRKLEPDARKPRRLVTVRGAGYQLVVT